MDRIGTEKRFYSEKRVKVTWTIDEEFEVGTKE